MAGGTGGAHGQQGGQTFEKQDAPLPGVSRGLIAAVPIVLGYAPIAFSFGVAATRAGLSPAEAVLLSAVVFAGAAQFLAIVLLTGGVPVLVAAATLIVMNLRHALYGPALLRQAGPDAARGAAWAWAFALTDEVFGAALGALVRGQRFSERFMLGLGFAAYAAWVLGTVAGALAGGAALEAYPGLNAGLGFMLPALFLALLLSMLGSAQVPLIVVAGAVTAAVGLAVSGTAGLLAGMVAGAAVGVIRR